MRKRTYLAAHAALLFALGLSACGIAGSSSTTQPATGAGAEAVAAQPAGPLAPELTGGQHWINSDPLTLSRLRGKVVLVDFWTYGCYNCKNTLPSLQSWWRTYKGQGLVIVGVHSPEFSSEAVLDNVQAATHDLGVTWPVVQDNDHAIWDAYGNHYWPHVYLIDKRGSIIYDHIGEGAYEETEQRIQAALAEQS